MSLWPLLPFLILFGLTVRDNVLSRNSNDAPFPRLWGANYMYKSLVRLLIVRAVLRVHCTNQLQAPS